MHACLCSCIVLPRPCDPLQGEMKAEHSLIQIAPRLHAMEAQGCSTHVIMVDASFALCAFWLRTML